MDLREYLFYNKKTVTNMAKEIDITRSYLSKIIHGRIAISKKIAKSIERATNGNVKISSPLPDTFSDRQPILKP